MKVIKWETRKFKWEMRVYVGEEKFMWEVKFLKLETMKFRWEMRRVYVEDEKSLRGR